MELKKDVFIIYKQSLRKDILYTKFKVFTVKQMKINKEGQISFLLKDGKYYISIILPKINRIYPIGDIIDIKLIPGYLF